MMTPIGLFRFLLPEHPGLLDAEGQEEQADVHHKLDAGGQQVDLNAIVNNPAFITQLSQMIERRLADNINGGNFKELKKNKQHTF